MSDPFAHTADAFGPDHLPERAPSGVSYLGTPSLPDLEASALRTIVDRAARGYPGAWTATWTASGVELRATGMRARILLSGPPGAVRVSLRATLGGQAVPEAARSLAVRCRDEAERFARAQTGPAPEAPPALPRGLPASVRTSGESPLAALVEQAIAASAPPASQWSVRWRGTSALVESAGCQFRIDGSRVSKAHRDWQDFTAPPPVPAEVVAVVDAVRVALSARSEAA